MQNLLKETIKILNDNGKTTKDVRFIRSFQEKNYNGGEFYYCSWDEFEKLADFLYDDGYGGNEINRGLMVVGDNWWLERGEYDGSEWWEFKEPPKGPDLFSKKITTMEMLKDY